MNSHGHWQEGQFSVRKAAEMLNNQKEYAFVLDAEGEKLDPTIVQNAWRLVRQKKATLITKRPMTIQLKKVVDNPNNDEIRIGIDDGAKHVGLALVQKCKTKSKVIFIATMEQRNDVHKLMEQRKSYRCYRRYWKRYRKQRFSNRANSERKERIAPTILQKRQAIVRLVDRLNKYIRINSIYLEDVAIDIRVLTDEKKVYSWQYQQSNRLDENLRKATILRDGCRCQICGKRNCRLEAHHITPRRMNGADTIGNLITLCSECHENVTGQEMKFAEQLYSKIGKKGNNFGLQYASHVMIGKTLLRGELSKRAPIFLTTGGDTANKRIDWDLKKPHGIDAVCITDLRPESVNVKSWVIKPLRHQRKTVKVKEVLGFRHRDIVCYTFKNREHYEGYITALYLPDGKHKEGLNFLSFTKRCSRVNPKKCQRLDRPNKFLWLI